MDTETAEKIDELRTLVDETISEFREWETAAQSIASVLDDVGGAIDAEDMPGAVEDALSNVRTLDWSMPKRMSELTDVDLVRIENLLDEIHGELQAEEEHAEAIEREEEAKADQDDDGETDEEYRARIENEDGVKVEITTNVYALSEHDIDALPFPMPADTWLWQSGDVWVAQVGMWHVEDWWEGADQKDIDARPERWARHILDVPTTGILRYADAEGNEISVAAEPGDEDEDVLRAERERLWQQLQNQGGRGVDLAERIDEIDGMLGEDE